MSGGIVDWIDFGQVSAERDENLAHYFFDNGLLSRTVRNRHSFLILGRKGAGKTAVFQQFQNSPSKYLSQDDILITASLQDYSWDIHGLLAAEGKAPSLAYIQSWRYVMYLLSITELAKKVNPKGRLKQATKIIEKVYSTPFPSLGQVVGQKLLQITRLKMPSGALDLEGADIDSINFDGGEISFAETQVNPSLQSKLNHSIERFTNIFEAALIESLSDRRRIFIALDRIDEAWDPSSYESSQKIIAGLIGASEAINSKFRGALRPILFIREDIFETIDINDKNKLRSDCGQMLAWDKDGLNRLVLERVNYFAKKAAQKPVTSVDALFDKSQMRQQRTPVDHILLRTMLRPRDFIKMLTLARSDMQERRDDPFKPEKVNSDRIECKSIYNVEPSYSEWLLEELRDEWRAQYPVINKLLEAIKNGGKTNFNRLELSIALGKVGINPTETDMLGYLKFLFDNSIIGFRVGKSNQWRFKCFSPSQGFVESDLYKVHDGLHRGLNLTESRSAPAALSPTRS